ncbi:MAG: efflux RND transporter permease subunit [Hyphomicrobiales bacterium]|nr:efflux RND transporter permease subunit [Hyphomicrobiales bacterium]MBV8824108.1 efflux RND transporter permease subunit [Hyphomicrobiales bacterium]MBV9428356.1 efflux RND transporter permease subunit [Bradyrhizobiaceae bacterium]
MFRAAGEQMRPILMMAVSAAIGLLAAAISTGIGSQVQRPLASVIGGMLIGPVWLLLNVGPPPSHLLQFVSPPPPAYAGHAVAKPPQHLRTNPPGKPEASVDDLRDPHLHAAHRSRARIRGTL